MDNKNTSRYMLPLRCGTHLADGIVHRGRLITPTLKTYERHSRREMVWLRVNRDEK